MNLKISYVWTIHNYLSYAIKKTQWVDVYKICDVSQAKKKNAKYTTATANIADCDLSHSKPVLLQTCFKVCRRTINLSLLWSKQKGFWSMVPYRTLKTDSQDAVKSFTLLKQKQPKRNTPKDAWKKQTQREIMYLHTVTICETSSAENLNLRIHLHVAYCLFLAGRCHMRSSGCSPLIHVLKFVRWTVSCIR